MIELNNIDSIHKIADWVELGTIFNGNRLSRAKMISLLEDNGYTDDAYYRGDEIFDSTIAELQRRNILYGPKSPYMIEGTIIQPNIGWEEIPEYLMCLILSYFGAANSKGGTKLFERVSQQALRAYMHGKGKVLGFPNNNNLTTQLDCLANEMYEGRGNRNPASSDKDRGVDVVGWMPFMDERNSQLIVLMQCAAGWNWRNKKPVPRPAWTHFIHWNHTTTIPGIAVAEVIELQKWQNAVDDYGLVFDRARIVRCLYANDFSPDPRLRIEVINWCKTQLK